MSAPAAAAEPAAGYARLRPGGEGAAVRGRAALMWVEGPDATGFLQGLLSNDVAGLAAGGACRALLLDARGHLQADVRVRRDAEDSFTLLLAAEAAERVAALLDRYHFSEDLDLLGPEEVELLTVVGAPDAARDAAEMAVPSDVPGAVDLVVPDAADAIARIGLAEAPPEALHMARVAAGVPRVGVDTGETTLVQEAGLEGVAVAFDKGCYLGQETVARAQFRGRVNRTLRGLRLPHPPPDEGARVLHAGREVGRLTSRAVTPDLGAIGLAILRREAAPGTEVRVEADGGSVAAVVVDLPFRKR